MNWIQHDGNHLTEHVAHLSYSTMVLEVCEVRKNAFNATVYGRIPHRAGTHENLTNAKLACIEKALELLDNEKTELNFQKEKLK